MAAMTEDGIFRGGSQCALRPMIATLTMRFAWA
jgi:hypothetical protein